MEPNASIVIDKTELADMISSIFAQSMSERRHEVISHSCFCGDPIAKAKHDSDHAVLKRLETFLDRLEKAKWSFAFTLLSILAGAACLALWEGAKALLRK